MLQVSHLRKQFTRTLAVDDVSFDVRPGQIFGLIGPNGAGKSTTIRMIMDILQPDRGAILLDGRPMDENTKNMIGYLPEERGLYRKNKLINVITYFGSLKGLSAREAQHAAAPLLELFSLADYTRRNVEELSKGNQQKVQFIVSVLHKPRLLVLDELFAGLDPVNQVLMKEALLELRKDNRAIIFSTHQMEQAEKLCDELLMINHGQTVLHGTPADIKRRYGRRALQVEFTGDGGFMRDLPGVRGADLAQNYAELELDEGVTTNSIIQPLLSRIELHKVARIEPSLQSIFIDIAGQDGLNGAEDAPSAPPPAKLSSKDPRVRKPFVNMLIYFVVAGIFGFDLRDGIEPLKGLLALAAVGAALWSFVKFTKARKILDQEARSAGEGNA